MKFLCALLGHRRSRREAKLNRETANWESVCKGCGQKMVRIEQNLWRIADGDAGGIA